MKVFTPDIDSAQLCTLIQSCPLANTRKSYDVRVLLHGRPLSFSESKQITAWCRVQFIPRRNHIQLIGRIQRI